MATPSHQTLVSTQFGDRAAAYVTSAAHATGEDLEQISATVAGVPGARVLDLGCGGGHASFAAAKTAREVVAYDLSTDMLAAVGVEATRRGLSNVITRQGAVEQLPFDDASFDMVISRFSAHHWSDITAGLAEARRVLKPGGQAIFIDTVAPANPRFDTWLQTIELLRDPSHGRNHSQVEWTRLLVAAGFTVDQVSTRRLRLDFASWVARIGTPELHIRAIRALQALVPADVAAYLALEPDGSFALEVAMFMAA